MLPRVETNFYKLLGASVLHLLQQRVPDFYKALLQPGCVFYNSVDGRFTYAGAPSGRMRARFVVFPINAVGMPLTYRFIPTSSTSLRSWCSQIAATAKQKLPGLSRSAQHTSDSPLCERNSHETTTISHRVQVQISFGTIYNINQELANK